MRLNDLCVLLSDTKPEKKIGFNGSMLQKAAREIVQGQRNRERGRERFLLGFQLGDEEQWRKGIVVFIEFGP